MDQFSSFSQNLDRDGFFVWPQLLPEDLIDNHVEAFLDLNMRLGVQSGEPFHSYSSEKQNTIKQARYDFHEEHLATQRLIFNTNLIKFLHLHFGEAPVVRQPETGLYHRSTPPHTDSLDFKVSPYGAEVRVWCALEDVHPDSGPIYFIPGSHKTISAGLEREVLSEHPEFRELLRSQMRPTVATEYFLATKPLWRYVKQVKLPNATKSAGMQVQPLLLRKGDAVVFSSDVVHGTCRCNDERRTRKYCVAFWAAKSSVWYHSRSFWGPLHDFRHPENSIKAPIHTTPFGLRMSFHALHNEYLDAFKRAVVAAM
jgi:Phytanoyl-CoA dioxygenase (PhyH)